MKSKVLCLTAAESKNPECWGYRYVKKNESRYKDIDVSPHLDTYDYGTTYVVVDDVVYTIARDFIDVTNNQRIYVLKDMRLSTDISEDDE